MENESFVPEGPASSLDDPGRDAADGHDSRGMKRALLDLDDEEHDASGAGGQEKGHARMGVPADDAASHAAQDPMDDDQNHAEPSVKRARASGEAAVGEDSGLVQFPTRIKEERPPSPHADEEPQSSSRLSAAAHGEMDYTQASQAPLFAPGSSKDPIKLDCKKNTRCFFFDKRAPYVYVEGSGVRPPEFYDSPPDGGFICGVCGYVILEGLHVAHEVAAEEADPELDHIFCRDHLSSVEVIQRYPTGSVHKFLCPCRELSEDGGGLDAASGKCGLIATRSRDLYRNRTAKESCRTHCVYGMRVLQKGPDEVDYEFDPTGCKETFPPGCPEYLKHIAVCPFRPAQCRHSCGTAGLRAFEIEEHEAACPWRKQTCPHCRNDRIRVMDFAAHLDACDEKVVRCKHAPKCPASFPQKDEAVHLGTVCEHEPGPCAWHEQGCTALVSKSGQAAHDAEAKEEHIMGTVLRMRERGRAESQLRGRVAELEAEVAALRAEARGPAPAASSSSGPLAGRVSGHDAAISRLEASLSAMTGQLAGVADELKSVLKRLHGNLDADTFALTVSSLEERLEGAAGRAELEASRAELEASRAALEGVQTTVYPLVQRICDSLAAAAAQAPAEREVTLKLHNTTWVCTDLPQLRAAAEQERIKVEEILRSEELAPHREQVESMLQGFGDLKEAIRSLELDVGKYNGAYRTLLEHMNKVTNAINAIREKSRRRAAGAAVSPASQSQGRPMSQAAQAARAPQGAVGASQGAAGAARAAAAAAAAPSGAAAGRRTVKLAEASAPARGPQTRGRRGAAASSKGAPDPGSGGEPITVDSDSEGGTAEAPAKARGRGRAAASEDEGDEEGEGEGRGDEDEEEEDDE
eukprot:tig00020562_g11161.t1